MFTQPRSVVVSAILLAGALLMLGACDSRARASRIEAPDRPVVTPNAVATLGGGCFWCLEALFLELDGVADVTSGYAGGHVASPTYKQVCSGTTGHAEVVQVRFDSTVISFADLLRVFYTVHDPTTLNRQGPDVGTQYRSVILTSTPEHLRIARDVTAEIARSGIWGAAASDGSRSNEFGPIVTQIAPLTRFWPAEDDHQRYFERNPDKAYCALVIRPKVLEFREKHARLLRGRSPESPR